METKRIPCKYCGEPTPMLGTKLCNGCWETARNVRFMDMALLAKILLAERSDGALLAKQLREKT